MTLTEDERRDLLRLLEGVLDQEYHKNRDGDCVFCGEWLSEPASHSYMLIGESKPYSSADCAITIARRLKEQLSPPPSDGLCD